ncbi:MAG: DUF5057 domain-containing protein [Lachnospiraceae bacterium]|nr:DUF5057 domain-containing protein [Lachnospiraceae bacterium]
MNKKIKSESIKMRSKRKLSGIMAAVLVVTGLGTVTYFQGKSVQAKDTLESISQVVNSINDDNPFTILEVVPDSVSFDHIALKNAYGEDYVVSGNQTMGYMGYYVKGSEPIRQDMDNILNDKGGDNYIGDPLSSYEYSTLSDSNLRYNMFKAFANPLVSDNSSIAYNDGRNNSNSKPLYINDNDGYYEIRQGETLDSNILGSSGSGSLSENGFDTYVEAEGFSELKRDYSGEYGEAYVDTAAGYMTMTEEEYGNYIKRYDSIGGRVVSENDTADDSSEEEYTDIASVFLGNYLSGEETRSVEEGVYIDDNFCYVSFNKVYSDPDGRVDVKAGYDRAYGEFDPNLLYVGDSGEANVYASFRYDENLTGGYTAKVVDELTAQDLKEYRDINGDRVPVYTFDEETQVYVYAGDICDVINDLSASVPNENKGYVKARSYNGFYTFATILMDDNIVKEEPDKDIILNNDNNIHIVNDPVIEDVEGTIILQDDESSDNSTVSGDDVKDPEDSTSNNSVDTDDEDDEELSSDKTYYTLSFTYVAEPENNSEEPLYCVNEFKAMSAENGAQYMLDKDSEYGPIVSNVTGRGVITVCDSNMYDCFIYDYGYGRGNYAFKGVAPGKDMLVSEADAGVYKIRGAKIYYRIKITNNEWFKRFVLDREEGEQCDKLPVKVNTVKASELTVNDIINSNLITIMSAESRFCIGNKYNDYIYEKNDISYNSLTNILNVAVKDSRPVIADHRIADVYEKALEEAYGDLAEPNAYTLVKALTMSKSDISNYYDTLMTMSEITFANNQKYNSFKDYVSVSNNYVNENIYIYDYVSNGQYNLFLNDIFMNAFDNEAANGNFSEVKIDIETENLFRKAEKLSQLDTTVSQATTIRYIIGFNQKRISVQNKGVMRILEIEPCAAWNLSTDTNEVDTDGTLLGTKLYASRRNPQTNKTEKVTVIDQEGAQIRVTRMSSAEFIGRIEDINVDYDMIYFGMNISKFNTRKVRSSDYWNANPKRITEEELNLYNKYKNSNSSMVPTIVDYNDLNMDGLVYTNVGDYAYMRIHIAGMLDSEYYSNNKNVGGVRSSTEITQGGELYKTRYSGNDITEEKVNALEDFVDAGYPIVVDDDFYMSDSNNEKVVNTYRIDRASYMYKFLDDVKGEDNVFSLSNLSPKLFSFYLNLAKPEISMSGLAYDSMSNLVTRGADAEDGYFYLPFNFTVSNKAGVSYDGQFLAGLYLDINSDGKYSEQQEGVDFTSLKKHTDDGDVEVSKSGNYYVVEPGYTYYGQYRLSGGQTGVVPWRIVVKQDGNTSRRANATGYYQLSNAKPTVKILQVNSVYAKCIDYGKRNEIMSSHYTYGDNYKNPNRNYTIYGTYDSNWDMEETMANGKAKKARGVSSQNDAEVMFYELMTADVIPYDIEIETISCTEFGAKSKTFREKAASYLSIAQDDVANLDTNQRIEIKEYVDDLVNPNTTTYDLDLFNKMEDEYYDYLADYDMVIMGFGDAYVPPNRIGVSAIKKFVATGHSILFTHDCTSMMSTLIDVNGYSHTTAAENSDTGKKKDIKVVSGYDTDTGYECNILLRHLVGMDRYDVLGEADDTTYVHDSIYVPRGERTDSNKITETQIHGFTYGNLNTCGYFGTSFSNMYESRNGYTGSSNSGLGYSNLKGIDRTADSYSWTDSKGNSIHSVGHYSDMTVKKINDGQITEYPYKLPDTFNVADTHSQWFQLDFTADDDRDGESDIVVWYCIEGSNNIGVNLVENNTNTINGNSKTSDMYEISSGDVRNNYYIYNKGNVTYSGVGHSSVIKEGSENEMKLFVNTMVAAYRSGIHPPEVSFKEGYNGRRNTSNIYITYDEQLEASANNGVVGSTKELYFMPEQTSIVQNAEYITHNLSAKLYYEVPAGTEGSKEITYNTQTYNVKELPIESDITYMDPKTGEIVVTDLNNLKNAAVHKVNLKLDEMEGLMTSEGLSNMVKVFVEATDYVKNSRTTAESSMTSVFAAKILRTDVFDLD